LVPASWLPAAPFCVLFAFFLFLFWFPGCFVLFGVLRWSWLFLVWGLSAGVLEGSRGLCCSGGGGFWWSWAVLAVVFCVFLFCFVCFLFWLCVCVFCFCFAYSVWALVLVSAILFGCSRADMLHQKVRAVLLVGPLGHMCLYLFTLVTCALSSCSCVTCSVGVYIHFFEVCSGRRPVCYQFGNISVTCALSSRNCMTCSSWVYIHFHEVCSVQRAVCHQLGNISVTCAPSSCSCVTCSSWVYLHFHEVCSVRRAVCHQFGKI